MKDLPESFKHRRFVEFDKMPASTLAQYVLKDGILVTGQHHNDELLNVLRSLARQYEDAFFEGFFIWYTEEVEHDQFPNEYNLAVYVDGIKIYNQLTRETLFKIASNSYMPDEISLSDNEISGKLNLKMWWD